MKKEIAKQFQWLKHNKKIIVICANTVYITVSVVLGSALTAKAVKIAQTERGYMAAGGEWLVLLIVLLISGLLKSVFVSFFRIIKEISKKNNDMAQVVELQSYRRKKRR